MAAGRRDHEGAQMGSDKIKPGGIRAFARDKQDSECRTEGMGRAVP
jgi:hypothetical protein